MEALPSHTGSQDRKEVGTVSADQGQEANGRFRRTGITDSEERPTQVRDFSRAASILVSVSFSQQGDLKKPPRERGAYQR